jgi:hypothetical protein
LTAWLPEPTGTDAATATVRDVGSHDELMAAGGFYHDLYMSQFREAAAPATAP